ncbi:MAG: restriction endonuclease subunit M, partial [Candidatus Electrothrix sp. EH2]|nr:restriction endonuclease subunit M [Candidatus Electrothrix sp. EH2]
ESNKKKKGTTEVDIAFLHEIENWRELLARNIALRNSELSQRELNFAVQQTIDRIVFLRICEDRGMERYGVLRELHKGENVYQRLFYLFKKADEKYNSGLFHFKEEKGRENCDNLTPSLQIDDKPLKEIFKNLYYPESPYEFSVLSADILGQVYERFLGKVIRLTPGHQAKIEKKPEVRKAGGVYYTPSYIVNYIVQNTVGKLVHGKKAGPTGAVSKLKILDPACGSGSFLLGAYQFLLDWHQEQYITDIKRWSKGKKARIYQSSKGEWRLTIYERKRILLNNIYGVDIDHQAVEVTKLSLLLKVLEGEDEQSIGKRIQRKVYQERVLPDLSNNIKCGNSLIGLDFYDNQQLNVFDEEEDYRVNAFDWKNEFPDIMKNGGFDAVIGNPPYIFARDKGFDENDKNYFYEKYTLSQYQINTFILFLEKGFRLLKPEQMLGFIVPNNWLTIDSNSDLREFLLKKTSDLSIITFNDKVFRDANVDTCLVFFRCGSKPDNDFEFGEWNIKEFQKPQSLKLFPKLDKREIKSPKFYLPVSKLKNAQLFPLLNKIEKGEQILKNIAQVSTGIKAYQVGKGKPPQTRQIKESRAYHSFKNEDENFWKYLEGRDVCRYSLFWEKKEFIKYGKNVAEPRFSVDFSSPRILVRQIPSKLPYCFNATYTEEKFINDINSMVILNHSENYDLKFLLGVINSKVLSFWFYYTFDKFSRKIFPQFKVRELGIFPIPQTDPKQQKPVIDLVDRMLDLNRRIAESRMPQETEILKRQIESTDKQIDDLVYKLYDLTDKEIKIVESES